MDDGGDGSMLGDAVGYAHLFDGEGRVLVDFTEAASCDG